MNPMNLQRSLMVEEFQIAFETSLDPNLWIKLVGEEKKEVNDAFKNLLKELCDLAYVAYGLALAYVEADDFDKAMAMTMLAEQTLEMGYPIFGQDIMEEAFARVHRSNMSKLGDDGKPIRREDGKVLKGPNYQPPNFDDLLNAS